MVSLYLWDMSSEEEEEVEFEYSLSIIDGSGKIVAYKHKEDSRNWGWENFAKRSLLLNSLVDGTLVIEVRARLLVPEKFAPSPFLPENPSACKIIQGLFMNDKSADIVFEVGGEEKSKDNAMTVAKTEPVLFPAHRCIVENCSSILADMCASRGGNTGESSPIEISDVSPDIFRLLLFYMYGGKVPDNDMKSHAKEIIDAADRYGVSSLKLEAEVCLVNATIFGVENLKDILLYADSKNCALLKEAAMDYMVENQTKLLGKVSFHDAPGSLLNDFIAATARQGSQGTDDNEDSQYNTLGISELRKKAYEIGLNVDGSREMLIAALKKVHELESKGDLEESDEEPVEE
jgi:hypothetical protein